MNYKLLSKKILAVTISVFALLNTSQIYSAESPRVSSEIVEVKNVPLIKQFPELPTGCEATALTMLLKHSGANVTKQAIADRIPRVSLPYYKNGVKYGGDPTKGFVGNPYSQSSFGVFEDPIIKVIDQYFPNQAEKLSGKSLNGLLEIVKEGRPVMIWATIDMKNIVYKHQWILPSGKNFNWPGKEHALLITGYDSSYIYLNDPYTGTRRKFQREVVQNRYNALGKRAVAIKPKEEKSIVLSTTINGERLEALEGKQVILKADRILVPVNYLKNLDSSITADYKNNKIYLKVEGQEIELDKGKNKVSIQKNGISVEVYYEVHNGVTRVDIKGLKRLLPMTYELQGKNLIIEADKKLELVIDDKPFSSEKGKEVILRRDSIYIPITYINTLSEQLKYSYLNNRVHIHIDTMSYILEPGQQSINISNSDKNMGGLAYHIENGVTRVDFKWLAKYLDLDYSIKNSTISIHTGDKYQASDEEIVCEL